MNLILSALLFLTPIIDEAIPEGPFRYPGSRPREVIIVDPENSPRLDQAYRALEGRIEGLYRNNLKNGEFGKEAAQILGSGASEDSKFWPKPTKPKTDSSGCFGITEEQILETVFWYVREELFDLSLCNERLVQLFIHSLYPDETEPEIPLETFLEHKIGVCRHIALATTCLVDRLVKEGWLEGEALLIRANCPTGRHAWTLFLSEEGAWHLDSLWGIFENGKTGAGLSKLCDNYGKRIMNEQKKRWENPS